MNAACLSDLREGLCQTRVDAAFLTDHPDLAADQSFEALFHHQDADVWVDVQGAPRGNLIRCDNGHEVLWMPGIEDELMPVSLDRHVSETAEENDRLYNGSDEESILAEQAAGAAVFVAHTEGRVAADLERLQDQGLAGVEIFNLHAMFAPDIREADLDLDGFSWLADMEPFTAPEALGEPDLMFLAVLQDQRPSLERWDALLQRGPMTGVGGTDAHQNVMPMDLRDGERWDSYRRMLRWFSNVIWVTEDGPDGYQAALEAGRSFVAFEILGTPTGFDFYLDDGAAIYEMGSSAPAEGILEVGCPALTPDSPQGTEDPDIRVEVYRDGALWREGCGPHPTEGPGVYRVQVDLTPTHLREVLGDDPDRWMVPFPWIRSNAIRVGL